MASFGAAASGNGQAGPPPDDRSAFGLERHPVHVDDGMPVAPSAEGFSTDVDGSAVLTAATPAPSSKWRWRRSAHGAWRSSSVPIPPKASNSCPDDGLSSAPLRGSTQPPPRQGLRSHHRKRRRLDHPSSCSPGEEPNLINHADSESDSQEFSACNCGSSAPDWAWNEYCTVGIAWVRASRRAPARGNPNTDQSLGEQC